MFSTTTTLLSLSTLLLTTPTILAENFVVNVGQGGLKFTPDNVKAKQGDIVEFAFFPANHSVVSSTFQAPCTPQEDAIFSGFMPVQMGQTGTQSFFLTVNDTKPIWIYCSQGMHCKQGMVMAINAPDTGNTLEAFRTTASKFDGASISPPNPQVNKGSISATTASPSAGNNTMNGTSTMPSGSGTMSGSGSATGTAPAQATSNAAMTNMGTVSGVLGVLGGVVAMGML